MNRWLLGSFATVALIAAGCGAGSVADNPKAKDAKPAAVAGTTAATDAPAAPEADETTPDAAPVTTTPPKAGDFKLTVKTTKKDCFGSAGCNVEYHIDVTTGYLGDEDTEYQVTYEVSGVQDGPKINSFTFQHGKYTRDESEFAQTKSSKAKLTAKVTDVSVN